MDYNNLKVVDYLYIYFYVKQTEMLKNLTFFNSPKIKSLGVKK